MSRTTETSEGSFAPIQLRIGLLGCGRIGALHARILAHHIPAARLVSVFDPVASVAKAVAAATGAAVASSIDSVIGEDSLDAIAICTPTDTHVALIERAAGAGLHIMCEKPIALDLGQVDRALAAVNAAGVKLHIGLNRRFDPSHRAVAEGVRAGDVGELHLLRITSRDPGPPPISYVKQSGGLFLDMTIHDFDMARFVSGSEVVSVFATSAVRVDPEIGAVGDIDTAVTVITHENGTITTIDNSRRAAYGFDQRVEAFGSLGSLASDNHRLNSTMHNTADGSRQSRLQDFFLDRYFTSYVNQWVDFIGAVRDDTDVSVGGGDGRACFVVGLAAGRSASEGRLVAIAEFE